jgi:hypothetical protein
MLLLLVLRLLEGAGGVTPLPTNNAKIREARKSKTKRAIMYLGTGSKGFFFFSFFHSFFLSFSRAKKVVEDP